MPPDYRKHVPAESSRSDDRPNGGAPSASRARRVIAWTVIGLGVAVVLLQTPPMATRVAGILANGFAPEGIEIEIGSVGWLPFASLDIQDLSVVDSGGRNVFEAGRVKVDHRLLSIIRGSPVIESLEVFDGRVTFQTRSDGSWGLGWPSSEGTPATAPGDRPFAHVHRFRLARSRVEVVGKAATSPGAWTDTTAVLDSLSASLTGLAILPRGALTADVDTIQGSLRLGVAPQDYSIRLMGRGILDGQRADLESILGEGTATQASGWLAVEWGSEQNQRAPRVTGEIRSPGLAPADIRSFVPSWLGETPVRLALEVDSPMDTLELFVDAETPSSGSASGTIKFAPDHLGWTVEFDDLTPQVFLGPSGVAGQLNGSSRASLSGGIPSAWTGPLAVRIAESRLGEATLAPSQVSLSINQGFATGEVELAAVDSSGETTIAGELRGRVFDVVPQYAFDGSLLRSFNTAGKPRVFRGLLSLDGASLSPDDLVLKASLRADMRKTPSQLGAVDLRSLDALLDVDESRGVWTIRSELAEGSVDGTGELYLGNSETRLTVERLRWASIDLAAILGDTIASETNGEARAVLESRRGPSRHLISSGFAIAGPTRYGGLSVDSTRLAWGLDEEAIAVIDGQAWAGDGTLSARVQGSPLDSVPHFTVTEGTIAAVDLVSLGLSPSDSGSTDLSGTFGGSWTGSSLSGAAADFRWRVNDSRVSAADSLSSAGSLTIERGHASVEGEVQSSAGGIALAASAQSLSSTPVWRLDRIAFDDFDPLAWTTEGVSGDVVLVGEGSAEGRGFDPQTATGSGTLVLDGSRAFSSELSRSRIDLDFRSGRWEARLVAAIDSMLVEGNGSFRLADRPQYEAGLSFWVGSTDSTEAVAVALEGTGTDPETATARLVVSVDTTAYWGVGIDQGSLVASLEEGYLVVDSLNFVGPSLQVRGGGGLALSDDRTSDFALRADLQALDVLRPVVDARPLSIGEGAIELEVTGLREATELTAMTSTNAILWGELQLVGFETTATGTLDGFKPLAGSLDATATSLQTPSARVERTDASLRYDGDVVLAELSSLVDPRRQLEVEGRIDPHPDRRSVELDRLNASLDADQWSLSKPSVVHYGSAFRVDSFDLRAGDQRFFAHGAIPREGELSFDLLVEGFGIETVSDLLGWPGLGGDVSGALRLRGTPTAPMANLTWSSTLDSPQALPVELAGEATYETSELALDARVAGDDGELTVRGALPLRLQAPWVADSGSAIEPTDGPVRLSIASDSLRFGWLRPILDPAGFRSVAGRLSANIEVSGSATGPTLRGQAELSAGRVEVEGLGTEWEGLQGRVSLDRSTVHVDSLSLRSGDGTLSVLGAVELERLNVGAFDLTFEAEGFEAVDNSVARAVVSGSGTLGGTTLQPMVRGDLELISTDVFLGRMQVAHQVAEVELGEADYQQLESLFGRDFRTRPTPRLALVDSLDAVVNLSLGRDTWIRQSANPRLAIQWSGEIQVSKARADSLSLLGSVTAVEERSYLEQFGRRFRLSSGGIEFRGAPSNTSIDIQGTYSVPSIRNPDQAEVSIDLGVRGTPAEIQIVLSSQPEMDNSDIVSYLATGRPASQDLALGGRGAQGLTDIGTGLAVDAVTNAIEGAAAEQVGLDVIDIETDGLEGARLVAGRYVSPRLFVGFRQPLSRSSESDRSRGGQYGTEVELEYSALRWLLLNLQAGGRGFDVLLRSRVAY